VVISPYLRSFGINIPFACIGTLMKQNKNVPKLHFSPKITFFQFLNGCNFFIWTYINSFSQFIR